MIRSGDEHDAHDHSAHHLTLRPATPATPRGSTASPRLDSAEVPAGPLVLAERDEQIIAAISATTMEAIADPFERSADAVALLRQHVAAQVRTSRRRRRLALVPGPRKRLRPP